MAYDALTRLPLVIWFILCGWTMWTRLRAEWTAPRTVDAALVLDALAELSAIAFVLIVILSLALRRPAIARAPGLIPRVVAFAGAFSITGLALFEPTPLSPMLSGASLVFMVLGYGFACYCILHLGRSLSLMAEARKLVTSGPYTWVRHPLYLAEAIASLGLLLQYLSTPAFALWLVHMGLQLRRIHYEEAVLSQTFPSYEAYAQRVARLVPGVY